MREREKKREKERENMFRVNYYQSAFTSQKKYIYIGRNTRNLKKWPCGPYTIIDH